MSSKELSSLYDSHETVEIEKSRNKIFITVIKYVILQLFIKQKSLLQSHKAEKVVGIGGCTLIEVQAYPTRTTPCPLKLKQKTPNLEKPIELIEKILK